MNKMISAITGVKRDKAEVKLNVRLKKNGQFSSIVGRVSEIKMNNDGELYAVVVPKEKSRHIQSVLLANVMAIMGADEKRIY